MLHYKIEEDALYSFLYRRTEVLNHMCKKFASITSKEELHSYYSPALQMYTWFFDDINEKEKYLKILDPYVIPIKIFLQEM